MNEHSLPSLQIEKIRLELQRESKPTARRPAVSIGGACIRFANSACEFFFHSQSGAILEGQLYIIPLYLVKQRD